MFFQAINALQEPTPNWTNLRRNVSKMSEMSKKFNDSKVVGKVPQRSDASQNDHKSKGCPSKTSEAAFNMQKADKGDLRRLARLPLK